MDQVYLLFENYVILKDCDKSSMPICSVQIEGKLESHLSSRKNNTCVTTSVFSQRSALSSSLHISCLILVGKMTRDSSVPHLYVVFLTIIAALFPVVSANNGTIPKDIIHLDQNQTQVDLTLHIPGEKDQAIEVFIAPSALIKNSLRIRTRSLSEVSVIVNNAQGSLFWNLKPHEDGTGLETQERTMFIGPR